MPSIKTQVSLVIKHTSLSDIIQNELSLIEDINLVCFVHSKEEMISCLGSAPIDLVLLDAGLDSDCGFECSDYIKDNLEDIETLALSTGDDSLFIREMIKNGVSGFILKNAPSDRLAEAISAVVNGGKYYDPNMNELGNSANEVKQLEKKQINKPSITLNIREQLIMRFLIDDLTETQIAQKLVLTPREVSILINKLMQKTHSNNVLDLLRYASEYDLVRT